MKVVGVAEVFLQLYSDARRIRMDATTKFASLIKGHSHLLL